MTSPFQKKIDDLKKIFTQLATDEEKYLLLMRLGKNLHHLSPEHKIKENLIEGCQSSTYVYTSFSNGIVNILAESDALISSGLAYLLITVYNRESPSYILEYPPTFIKELGINDKLPQVRREGFLAIYERLRNDAQKYLSA